MSRNVIARCCCLAAAGLALAAAASGQDLSPQEQAAALKASLAASQAVLRQHEWIETTIVRLKGEEKSRLENRCYYGADGQLQKVPVAAPAAPQGRKKRGLRGAIIENKKEELADYMKAAVALVKEYVPPDQARIQAAKDAGRVSLQPMPGAGQRMWLSFADFVKPGDRLAVDLSLATSQVLGVRVSSYLASAAEPVTLNVTFATFTDGKTSYAKTSVLDAPAKNLQVEIQNSGYRKLSP